ncbi:IS630 family transposase [Terasakiella brassicae]|uniref:IS630 family transposase n=1 Tax=Terasakiella brassicae TaxID=1634917 RepID=UPI003570F8B2
MAAPIPLQNDFNATKLRKLTRSTSDATQARRLLSLAVIYDGGTRTDASNTGDVTLQIIRDWLLRFNKEGPEGLAGRKPCLLNEDQLQALEDIIEKGPTPAIHTVVRWRLCDLTQWIWEEYRISISTSRLGILQARGWRKLSARPCHRQCNEEANEAFKKTFAGVTEIQQKKAQGKDIEIWFQDEARIGQNNKQTRRWAKRGTRPEAIQDLRNRSAYIFGAICPKEGKAAGIVMPKCNTYAMEFHLQEISLGIAENAHAVIIMDQAAWHTSGKLKVPDNITIVPLPPKSPELNPVENIWQFMRDNWLSNRVFKSYNDIVDHCCYAWNLLCDQPWKIMSIGMRDWAHRS